MTRRTFIRSTWAIIVGILLVLLLIYFVILPGYNVRWTGFGEGEVTKETTRFAATGEKTGTDLTVERQNPRTIWDWVGLLGVGSALAVVGYFFARHQRKRDEAAANERRQGEALQAFLDQMSDVMIGTEEKRNATDLTPYECKVAQARTIAILLASDQDHKRSPLKLVYELGLIGKDAPLIALRNASLDRANLGELALPEACLRHADLRTTDLSGANLRGADLSEADLRGARLINADLSGADLTNANLLPYDERSPAKLSMHNLKDKGIPSKNELSYNRVKPRFTSTDLTNTNLEGANLSGAFLGDTNLTLVRGLTSDQIDEAIGNQATQLRDPLQRPQNWEQPIENQIAELLIARLNRLKAQVDALVTSGTLNSSQGNALTSNLDAALQYAQDNNTQPITDQIKEFTNQVNTFIQSNVLTSHQGQLLIRKASEISTIS